MFSVQQHVLPALNSLVRRTGEVGLPLYLQLAGLLGNEDRSANLDLVVALKCNPSYDGGKNQLILGKLGTGTGVGPGDFTPHPNLPTLSDHEWGCQKPCHRF